MFKIILLATGEDPKQGQLIVGAHKVSKIGDESTLYTTRVARLKSIKIPHQDLKNPRMQQIFSK